MGFREHSHYFTGVHKALKEGDLAEARRLLGEWRGHPCDALSAAEVARLAIEGAFTVSHRHVFAVMFWFLLLPGPERRGALPHRALSEPALGADGARGRARPGVRARGRATRRRRPARADDEPPGRFGEFARRAFYALDWLPARFTAASFAIVGDFEDAIYCWRTQAARWPDPLLGIVLAAGRRRARRAARSPIARGGGRGPAGARAGRGSRHAVPRFARSA